MEHLLDKVKYYIYFVISVSCFGSLISDFSSLILTGWASDFGFSSLSISCVFSSVLSSWSSLLSSINIH